MSLNPQVIYVNASAPELQRAIKIAQEYSATDACIVYADFNVHDKRIILLMDFGSSHKGNMPATLVEEYITNFHKLRPGIIEAVKLSLAASEPENY